MEVPKKHNGMDLVKCYENYALYENKYYRECFTYHDLGFRTYQVRDRKVHISFHM